MEEVVTAKYRVTGLVNSYDEHMNITGTLEVGSVHKVPVEIGSKWVDSGIAELVEDELSETGETGEGGQDDELGEAATGETGEQEVE